MSEVRSLEDADTAMGVQPDQLCRVLELAMADSPLEQTLGELIRIVESTSRTNVLGSILLLDEDGLHLRHGAAPSLPAAYCDAIHGAEIGPCAGSCGTAAFRAEPVFVSDIANDPLWADFRELAEAHELRACW
jgi:GAF domain-containing protein